MNEPWDEVTECLGGRRMKTKGVVGRRKEGLEMSSLRSVLHVKRQSRKERVTELVSDARLQSCDPNNLRALTQRITLTSLTSRVGRSNLSLYFRLSVVISYKCAVQGDSQVCSHLGLDLLLRPSNVPTPASKRLDDFGGNGSREGHSEEDEGLVDAVCEEKLGPDACHQCQRLLVELLFTTTHTGILFVMPGLSNNSLSALRFDNGILQSSILCLHAREYDAHGIPEPVHDRVFGLSYPVGANQLHGEETKGKVEHRESKVDSHRCPPIFSRQLFETTGEGE